VRKDKPAKYALRPGRTGCDRLIVTDGIRYALYRREGEEFKMQAYLNILDMRDNYVIHGCPVLFRPSLPWPSDGKDFSGTAFHA